MQFRVTKIEVNERDSAFVEVEADVAASFPYTVTLTFIDETAKSE